MAGPTVFYHDSDDLKQRLLPKLLSGEEIWCQGFSEPGAGSDLASVQTCAERRGGRWIINGHKVWTSLAHFAQWMILLARTDKSQKYDGLSYFVVPIRAALGKGVEVRPLIKMIGETGFNEVIFEDLEVDDSYRLDEVARGCQVAMATLLYERGGGELLQPHSGGRVQKTEGAAKRCAGAYGLIDPAKNSVNNGKTAADDRLIYDRIVQEIIHEQGARQMEVEAAIDSCAGVRSCAVIGLPHTDLGNYVQAIVDAPDGITEEPLLAHLAERLARYKIPRNVEFASQPLRDDAGKVRRSALREERIGAVSV